MERDNNSLPSTSCRTPTFLNYQNGILENNRV
nr:MAG TPA_asm: hypothetical protein [Caudoviricetes sp.]